MKGIDIDEMAFGMPDDTGAGDDLGGIGGEGVGTDGADGAAGMDDDPMSVLRRNPTVRNMVTVTFTVMPSSSDWTPLGLTIPRKPTACSVP